jgi:hypothetical protein
MANEVGALTSTPLLDFDSAVGAETHKNQCKGGKDEVDEQPRSLQRRRGDFRDISMRRASREDSMHHIGRTIKNRWEVVYPRGEVGNQRPAITI